MYGLTHETLYILRRLSSVSLASNMRIRFRTPLARTLLGLTLAISNKPRIGEIFCRTLASNELDGVVDFVLAISNSFLLKTLYNFANKLMKRFMD